MNKSDYYKDLRESFPLLVDDLTFDFDFEEDDERRNMFYNCIAHSLGFDDIWVWPQFSGLTLYPRERYGNKEGRSFWPNNVSLEETLNAFLEMYSLFGYKKCNNIDYEPGYRKIVIYGKNNNEVTHAALVHDGYCTSKMGPYVLISHKPESIVGEQYGHILTAVKRKDVISIEQDVETVMSHSGGRPHINLGTFNY